MKKIIFPVLVLFSLTACASDAPTWKIQDPQDLKTPANIPQPEVQPDETYTDEFPPPKHYLKKKPKRKAVVKHYDGPHDLIDSE